MQKIDIHNEERTARDNILFHKIPALLLQKRMGDNTQGK